MRVWATVGLTILATALLCLGAAMVVVGIGSMALAMAWATDASSVVIPATFLYVVLGVGITVVAVMLMRAATRRRISALRRTQDPPRTNAI